MGKFMKCGLMDKPARTDNGHKKIEKRANPVKAGDAKPRV
jgi:hypothetical protein